MTRRNVALLCAATLCAAAAAARADTNLLVNPGFDRGLQGWTPYHLDVATAWQSPDSDGSAGSGSAKVTATATGPSGAVALSQCVPVAPGTRYTFSAKIRTHSTVAPFQPFAFAYFTGEHCDGTSLGGNAPLLTPPAQDWSGLAGDNVAPASAHSGLLMIEGMAPGPAQIFEFDDVYVGPTPAGPCVPSATTLCLDRNPGDQRFAVQATFSSPPRNIQGTASAVSTAALGITRGGLLWFFDPTNPELLVKVIDGCPITDHFWVYIAAGTDVGVELTITDSAIGRIYLFRSPDGTAFPSIQSAYAIPCQF